MRSSQIMYGCLYAISGFIFLISLYSHCLHDASLFYSSIDAAVTRNWCGLLGAQISALLLYFFGGAAYFLVALCFALSARSIFSDYDVVTKESIYSLIAAIPLSSLFFTSIGYDIATCGFAGGVCGNLLANCCARIFDAKLMPLLVFVMVWALVIMLVGFSWAMPAVHLAKRCAYALRIAHLYYYCMGYIQRKYEAAILCLKNIKTIFAQEKEVAPENVFDKTLYDAAFWQPHTTTTLEVAQEQSPVTSDVVLHETMVQTTSLVIEEIKTVQRKKYSKPDVSKFKQRSKEISQADLQEQKSQAQILEEKLKRFGIRGSVLQITAGPVVTLFEYQPHIDVPISRIIAREDDLALALQAMSLRIIAPIPGRSVIGFEVANVTRKTVFFSDSVNSKEFTKSDAQLPLIIGQNTIGEQTIIDLTKMPHLLVAGSTGSGKSVALNAMLLSLLCKATPEEVRLILIDPKRLEFASYADVPHLMFPIVTDPKVAMNVLNFAIATMEARYEKMAEAGVRNIYDFRASQEEIMPYIVIVIDELADLMMVAGKDMEASIARLAQMARAAGIHLVLATQRPSVDVITGVVKVNFPARLACKVTSKVDSRTILDIGGAEKLLGRGDMLFLDPQGQLNRFHGAYVTDEEIASVVAHVKEQSPVMYEELPTSSKDCSLQGEDEELYNELVDFVRTVDEVSISLLQRRFRIGYNRSARFIDILESQGIIMPASGSKGRKVLH